MMSYIKKAEDDFAKQLELEGFIESQKTIEYMNRLEEQLAKILQDERDDFINQVEELEDIETIIDTFLLLFLINDNLTTEKTFKEIFTLCIGEIAESCIKNVDEYLAINILSNRTTAWIDSWSEELAQIMKLSSHDKLQSILKDALDNGKSIDYVTNELMSAYEFSYTRARATAVTEILTAHSVAKQESMMQNPAVDNKQWVHTGSHKNKPRQNHQSMSGQIVPKNDKYKLIGKDGETYHPMFPCDTSLPPAERIHCHCISNELVKDDIFGLSLEERKKLQQKAIDDDNSEWEKELNDKNKAKANIN